MAIIARALKIFIVMLCLTLLIAAPLQADIQSEAHRYLTIEILQERAANLVQQEGRSTIDLSSFIIDLSNLDSEFYQQFYQEIINTISRASNPVNINFDNSIIQGDFQLNRLGISTSLEQGALSGLFTPIEKNQISQYSELNNYQKNLNSNITIFRGSFYFNRTIFTGEVDSYDSIFLQSLIATNAKFQGNINLSQVIFSRELDFSNTIFNQSINLSKSHFFGKIKFDYSEFQGITNFTNTQFDAAAKFNQAIFTELADFSRSVFIQVVDFSNTIFRERVIFAKSKFLSSIILVNSNFEKTVTFRDIYLNSLLNLQDAHILNRLDFSNAFFTSQANINASGLAFDAAEARIIGQPGMIGQFIKVNRLQGNETVLRNLIRNFRSSEQIADANYLEYLQEQLRAKQLGDRLLKTSWQKVFSWSWISLILQWVSLNLLLLLGDYGTNINLIFSIGLMAIAFFSLLFWVIDRYRPHISQPIVPTRVEVLLMLFSYCALTIFSIINILISTNKSGMTLIMVAIVLIPIPMLIVFKLYHDGRYHKLLDQSYFVENAELREFRLLLGRLPIIPRFPFFRDRFMPIMWNKNWSWLNYYNFSLNNLFKIGFVDIRVRDQHLPGLIATLVWYQWCLGVLYVVLLLWTLSRTIPGLNLLIYF